MYDNMVWMIEYPKLIILVKNHAIGHISIYSAEFIKV